MFGFKGVNFDKDSGNGGGGAGADTADSTGAAGNGDQTITNADNAGDDKDKGKQSQKVTFSPEQQAEVDMIVKERLAREKKKSEADADKVRKQAEEEALTKNKEFEQLAETRKAKVGELEAQVTELTQYKDLAEKYKGAMEKILDAQLSKLPLSIKALMARLDPIEKMEYLTEHAKELNIDVAAVPETDTNDSTNKLNQEALNKAKQNNAKLIKTFLSG